MRFRGGLVFKAHRLVYHSRVIKKKKAAPGDERRTKSHTAFVDAMYPPTDPNDCVSGSAFRGYS